MSDAPNSTKNGTAPTGAAQPDRSGEASPPSARSDAAAQAARNGRDGHIEAALGVRPSIFARPKIDAANADDAARSGGGLADGVDAFASAARRAGVATDEILAASTDGRLAILLDAPRTGLLLAAAERASLAPEEVLIRALDSLLDGD